MTGNPKPVAIDSAAAAMLQQGLLESLPRVAEMIRNAALLLERIVQAHSGAQAPAEPRGGRLDGPPGRVLPAGAGKLALVPPPKPGPAGEPLPLSLLEGGSRADRALRAAIAELYLQGAATRRVRTMLEQFGGGKVSAEQVARTNAQLDQDLHGWRWRPLPAIAYLVLDAGSLKTRLGGAVCDCAVLVAIGVRRDNGKRIVLGVSAAVAAAADLWQGFLESLRARGIGCPEMVTAEDHEGLGEALRAVFGGIPWQRCQARLQEDAVAKAPEPALRRSLAAEIRSVFGSPDLPRAEARLAEVVEKHRKSAPGLAAWLAEKLPGGLAVFRLPEHCRRRLRTSNMAEGIKQQVKRRTRVVGLLPDEASVLRLVSAVLMELSEEWETGRAYLTLAPQRDFSL